MVSLIIVFLFALAVAYFALQNAVAVPIVFASTVFHSVPLYFVIIASVLVGIILSSLIGSIGNVSTYMKLRNKDDRIHNDEKVINDLQQKIHDLEIENAQLKSGQNQPSQRDAHPHIATHDTEEESTPRRHSLLGGLFHPHAKT